MTARATTGPPKATKTTQLGFNDFARSVGDTRVVSGASEVLRTRHIAAKNLSAEELIERLENGTVVILRPSWRAELPRFILLGAAIVLALWLTLMNPDSFIGVLPMYSFIPLPILAAILHKRYNSKYVLSEGSITAATGLLGWRYLRIRVDYDQLKAVEIEKDLIQRILNVGNIRLSTAMFDQPEVTMRRIANPQYFGSVIKIMQKTAHALETGQEPPALEEGTIVEE